MSDRKVRVITLEPTEAAASRRPETDIDKPDQVLSACPMPVANSTESGAG
jgi:hypothetical protein